MKRRALAKAFLFGVVCGPAFAADPLPALQETPMLAEQVKSGALPPVAKRVPQRPWMVGFFAGGDGPGRPGGHLGSRRLYRALPARHVLDRAVMQATTKLKVTKAGVRSRSGTGAIYAPATAKAAGARELRGPRLFLGPNAKCRPAPETVRCWVQIGHTADITRATRMTRTRSRDREGSNLLHGRQQTIPEVRSSNLFQRAITSFKPWERSHRVSQADAADVSRDDR